MQVGVSNYGAKELRRVARDFEKRGVQLASAQVGVHRITAFFCMLLLPPLRGEH
jgi:diketogulonate reductase-like aldo/keto reductase